MLVTVEDLQMYEDSPGGKYADVEAAALSRIVGEGFADEEAGSVETGDYRARVGEWIMREDSLGFVTSESYPSVKAAEAIIRNEDGEL
jgi:hypothetical protein